MKLYCIPTLLQLEEFYEYARENQTAFEYNEFFAPKTLTNEEEIRKIIEIYKGLERDRSEDTLHGAFLDIVVNSDDPEIYGISRKRVYQCMDIAREMGLKAVIFHTNYISNFRLACYRRGWLDKNEIFWRQVLEDYPDLMIYMENMFDEDPDLLCELAKRMAEEKRFGVCLDFAHAFVSGTPVDVWVDKLKPYIKHIHINDNDGIEDSHCPVGQGSFPWDKYGEWMGEIEGNPSVLIEVRGIEDFKLSVSYMKEKGLL